MRDPGKVSLLAAVVLLAGVVAALTVKHEAAAPPVPLRAAGITGEAWVMPGSKVPAFLRAHHAPSVTGVAAPTQAVVVGWVTWTARPGASDRDRFTVLLGDDGGGAGSISEIAGPAAATASLGSGSMWEGTMKRYSWLRGDRTVKLDDGSSTDFYTTASLPTSTAGDVWFVGRITDTPINGEPASVQTQARPVVGVALTTDDRVWLGDPGRVSPRRGVRRVTTPASVPGRRRR